MRCGAKAGEGPGHSVTHGRFVLRVGVSVQQADGDGVDIELLEPRDGGIDAGRVEGQEDLALGADALVDADPQLGGYHRRLAVDVEGVDLRSCLAADLQNVLEAARGDQCGPGAAALEQGVGCHRRTVDYTHGSISGQADETGAYG